MYLSIVGATDEMLSKLETKKVKYRVTVKLLKKIIKMCKVNVSLFLRLLILCSY